MSFTSRIPIYDGYIVILASCLAHVVGLVRAFWQEFDGKDSYSLPPPPLKKHQYFFFSLLLKIGIFVGQSIPQWYVFELHGRDQVVVVGSLQLAS